MSAIINGLSPAAADVTASRNGLYDGLKGGKSPEEIQILSLINQEKAANWSAATNAAKTAFRATESAGRPG